MGVCETKRNQKTPIKNYHQSKNNTTENLQQYKRQNYKINSPFGIVYQKIYIKLKQNNI